MNSHTFPSTDVLYARGADQRNLHEKAASAARAHFGNHVFVRAVVEISNFCRENCAYCGMRRENRNLSRFRAHSDQLVQLLLAHRPASVTDINIQAGEDPVAVRQVALPLIRALRAQTNLGISVCLGTLSPEIYDELQRAGARIYIMKFETATPAAYSRLRAPGTIEERTQHIQLLAAKGWRVSSGFIAGLPGQTEEELRENFRLAGDLPLAGCSVSPFIPGEETPLADSTAGDVELTLNCMAALRLMRPGWVIPSVSALNIAEPRNGYRRGLATGANLVTINLTPTDIRGDYLLYKRDRFIMTEERILGAIAAEGLQPSETSLAEHYRGTAATELAEAPAVSAG